MRFQKFKGSCQPSNEMTVDNDKTASTAINFQ